MSRIDMLIKSAENLFGESACYRSWAQAHLCSECLADIKGAQEDLSEVISQLKQIKECQKDGEL